MVRDPGDPRAKNMVEVPRDHWDEAVGLESVKYHYHATILVPNNNEQEPTRVGSVSDCGSCVTFISESAG